METLLKLLRTLANRQLTCQDLDLDRPDADGNLRFGIVSCLGYQVFSLERTVRLDRGFRKRARLPIDV